MEIIDNTVTLIETSLVEDEKGAKEAWLPKGRAEFLAWLGFTVEGDYTVPFLVGDERALPVSEATFNELWHWSGHDSGTWRITSSYYRENRERIQRFHNTIQARLVRRGFAWKAEREGDRFALFAYHPK